MGLAAWLPDSGGDVARRIAVRPWPPPHSGGVVAGRWGTPSTWGAAGEGTRLSGKRHRLELVTWKPMAVIAARVSRPVWLRS
jgi:hypothetical protein